MSSEKLYILTFTGDSPEKILSKEKDMTARLWLRKPPKYGQFVRCQRGRARDTQFAIVMITKVWEWDPLTIKSQKTNEELNIIGEREGFISWQDFYFAYKKLNYHNWNDKKRKHYFIEFRLIKKV